MPKTNFQRQKEFRERRLLNEEFNSRKHKEEEAKRIGEIRKRQKDERVGDEVKKEEYRKKEADRKREQRKRRKGESEKRMTAVQVRNRKIGVAKRRKNDGVTKAEKSRLLLKVKMFTKKALDIYKTIKKNNK